MARPMTNFQNEWSPQHEQVLRILAERARCQIFQRLAMRMEIWDLMIVGWLTHLRKCTPEQLKGRPVDQALWSMWDYGVLEYRRSMVGMRSVDLILGTDEEPFVASPNGESVDLFGAIRQRDRRIVELRAFDVPFWRVGKILALTEWQAKHRYYSALRSARRKFKAHMQECL